MTSRTGPAVGRSLIAARRRKRSVGTYQVPGAIESVKIVAFFAKEIADLTLQVSADGTAFTAVEPRRTERRLPSPPGGAAGGQRRTLVEYEASVPPGQRCLQIRWNGPAELDRVEIYQRL